MRMAEATHLANEEQAHFLAKLVEQRVGNLKGKTIALWGLAFKPETDDIRESPAIKLANVLVAKGARVVGNDPWRLRPQQLGGIGVLLLRHDR